MSNKKQNSKNQTPMSFVFWFLSFLRHWCFVFLVFESRPLELARSLLDQTACFEVPDPS